MTTMAAPATPTEAFPVDDVEFRAPLAPEAPPPEQSESLVRLLCRMRLACHVLDLKPEARFTSLVLLHRYAQQQQAATTTETTKSSILQASSMVAAACLLLGCKVENELRRLRDIVNVEWMILSGDNTMNDGGNVVDLSSATASVREIWIRSDPLALTDRYWDKKEQLVASEQEVLRALQFDCSVSHPHRAVSILLLPELTGSSGGEAPIPPAIQALIQASWGYLDRSFIYSPALQYDVLPMACAVVLLAAEDCAKDDETMASECDKYKPDTLWWHDYDVKDLQVEFAKRDIKQASNLYAKVVSSSNNDREKDR